MRTASVWLIILGLACGFEMSRAAETQSPEEMARLDRQWRQIQKKTPEMEVRGVFGFILTAAASHWSPDSITAALELCQGMQDRNPASPTFGNFRWYCKDTKPNDLNAVEFSMQSAALTWLLYRDQLTEQGRGKLREVLVEGIEGMKRHPVPVSYTNIFVMRLSNCALIGEALGRSDVLEQARKWSDEWIDYTKQYGVHEYNSPTYTTVDITSLGAIVRHVKDPALRAGAEGALRLLWTDVAANYFPPLQRMSGPHSRDYDFLHGRGSLDGDVAQSGLVPNAPKKPESLEHRLTDWKPPQSLAAIINRSPRQVFSRWGPDPGQEATNYIGQHFALGSAGASYEKQDRILALLLAGRPDLPIISFSMDDRDHPYGIEKIPTSGGHSKPIHLVPFVASVQRGPEVLLVASFDPAVRSERWPGPYATVSSNWVLPTAVELWSAQGRISPHSDPKDGEPAGNLIFVRMGDTAAALGYLLARDDQGRAAPLRIVSDGASAGARRFTCLHSIGQPKSRITTAIWVRAAEGLDEDRFAAFRSECAAEMASAQVQVEGDTVSTTLFPKGEPLRIVANTASRTRKVVEGFDRGLHRGILNIDGEDEGQAIFR